MTPSEAIQTFPPMWVVYENPSDYPGLFVVRTWYGDVHQTLLGTYDTYSEVVQAVRGQGASGYLIRDDDDDPCIREVWL